MTTDGCRAGAEPDPLIRTSIGAGAGSAPTLGAEVGEPMETLVEAIVRLRSGGYHNDLFASPDGNLVCCGCGTSHDPEALQIRETVRFEGDSNPDDEAILLAVASNEGCLGLFAAAYGPTTAAADTMALRRLALSGAAVVNAGRVRGGRTRR